MEKNLEVLYRILLAQQKTLKDLFVEHHCLVSAVKEHLPGLNTRLYQGDALSQPETLVLLQGVSQIESLLNEAEQNES